ncbi:MAG TPA: type II toxin-antitoxin system VapC family toxin [Mycobacteriales bacterium]
MTPIILDSTILIDHLRGVPEATAVIDGAPDQGLRVSASVVTKTEVLRGMRSGERRAVRELFGLIVWVPVDEPIADLAGEYGRIYRASHRGIDLADFIIAATAMRADAELWTRNVKHFPMFDGLEAPY